MRPTSTRPAGLLFGPPGYHRAAAVNTVPAMATLAVLVGLGSAATTALGGLVAIRVKDHRHLVLGARQCTYEASGCPISTM
jgi:hypothetical protein